MLYTCLGGSDVDGELEMKDMAPTMDHTAATVVDASQDAHSRKE